MGLGLIGVGRWGKNLARNFHELNALHTVCDCVQPDLGFQYTWVSDPCALFENPQITQIAIATPPDTHYPLAKQALLAKKDVFVEKPFCFQTQQAIELTALAAKNNCILMVGHLLHYHPAIVHLKQTIQSLGNIVSIQATRTSPVLSGTSVLWDLGPHDVSLVLSLLEPVVLEIECWGSAEHCTMTLTFPNATKALIDLHTGPKHQELIITGSKAIAIFRSNQILLIDGKEVSLPKTEPLRCECEHFLHCCKTRQSPLTDGCEAIAVIEVLQKAEEKRAFPRKYQSLTHGN